MGLKLLLAENFAKISNKFHSFRKNSWVCVQNGAGRPKNTFLVVFSAAKIYFIFFHKEGCMSGYIRFVYGTRVASQAKNSLLA